MKNVNNNVRALALASLLAALTCVATLAIRIPSPTGGYMNLGDTVVLLSGYLLGAWPGAAAGAIGAALADLAGGYPVYIPATLVIKGLMPPLAVAIYHAGRKKPAALCAAGLAAGLLMVLGYWLYDSLLMRSLAGAMAGIPSNLAQCALCAAASTVLTAALARVRQIREWFPKL